MPTTYAIIKGNQYFDATLYTGNSQASAITVTNAGGFQPDLVWIKDRTQAGANVTSNSLDGSGNYLFTNSTNQEGYNTAYVTSLNSNGFTVGTNGNVNYQTDAFVAWQWKANGSGVTNTSGSITSTVSANTTSGFSIVTYTGNGTGGATVGHGLGVAPSMIIAKRTSGAANWLVGTSVLGWTKALNLDLTDAAATTSTAWNNTAPTSSVFTAGNSSTVNGNGSTYVAYCFAEVNGYSKFGSYTGNGSSNGPFIYTGFRPRYIMTKVASSPSTDDWLTADTARFTYNVVNMSLAANLSNEESYYSGNNIDILSNGFKIRNSGNPNTNGATYIYMAFAEMPTKYANAR